jgi:hypothetical protein
MWDSGVGRNAKSQFTYCIAFIKEESSEWSKNDAGYKEGG